MKIFDKVKNLFTEEIEEEPVIKKEVRHIEVEAPKKVEKPTFEEKNEDNDVPKKEDKFVFFSDDDFKDLEKTTYNKVDDEIEKPSYYRKREEIQRPSYSTREEVEKPYYRREDSTRKSSQVSRTIEKEEKRSFKPSLIISPVYGVLDKNYSKDEIVSKKRVYKNPENVSVDDIRNKAYGTLEDELKDALLGRREESIVKEINDIDIFEELDKYKEDDLKEKEIIDVDDLFDSLDNKKEEILDELDNKKDEILDELDSKKDGIIISDDEIDDDSLDLKEQIENQRRKLDEINDMLSENEEITDSEDDLNESELFDLIDSIYEKKDDE